MTLQPLYYDIPDTNNARGFSYTKMGVKLRLVFHWWCPDNVSEYSQYISDIHLKLLINYLHFFNESVIVFATDTGSMNDMAYSIQKSILETRYPNTITFKVIKNDPLIREGKTYYEEIIDKMDKLDGLTFWGHSKGMADDWVENYECIVDWITCMWYLNLHYLGEVMEEMCGASGKLFYGALLSSIVNFDILAEEKTREFDWWRFFGSFYWIRGQRLYEHIVNNGKTLPKDRDNRMIAENFPADIVPLSWAYMSVHAFKCMVLDWKPYSNFSSDYFFNEGDDYNTFVLFKEKVTQED